MHKMSDKEAEAVLKQRGLSTERLKELLAKGLDVRREMHDKYAHLRRLTSKERDLNLKQDQR